MIKIVRGNDSKLSIPVEQNTGVDSDGKPILQPYDLSKVSNLKVVLKSQYSNHTLSFEVDSNVITFIVSGKLPNGVYNIEITGVDENGMSIRSYELSQFKIVESNQEADLYPTTEFEITSAWLNSQIFINYGGIGSLTLGGLINVTRNVDSAPGGSILVKEGKEWIYIEPSENVDKVSDILLPVFDIENKSWKFVHASYPLNDSFPYTFPFKLK